MSILIFRRRPKENWSLETRAPRGLVQGPVLLWDMMMMMIIISVQGAGRLCRFGPGGSGLPRDLMAYGDVLSKDLYTMHRPS